MDFQPTSYDLASVRSGRIFSDSGWTLSDDQDTTPSLIRAIYKEKSFKVREDLEGIYRYANWMPVRRILSQSSAPVTYRSEKLAAYLGRENLYITFSGYNPSIGARFRTCSFKETEAYSVLGRLDENEKRVLIIQSAGNTARAFAQVCSDNKIPVVICIPQDSVQDLWFQKELDPVVKLIATPEGSDYYDAIALGEKLAKDPMFLLEGGAKNIARRDGMGTVLLSAAEKMGRIPDAYFQAVGSGTGAIAAWEMAERLAATGDFQENNMRVYVSQNEPFTLIYDSWKRGSRELVSLSAEDGRRMAKEILAKVLSNRKPPYSLDGGLYDVLRESHGDVFLSSNDEILHYQKLFLELEGYDLLHAPAVAVASLVKAVEEGKVLKDEYILLNITGGGMRQAKEGGYVIKQPDLIFPTDTSEEEVIAKVRGLFQTSVKRA